MILQTTDLSKKFSGKFAVYQANITIEPGKIYGLLGPNGSGKSTLMKMVAGLFHPNEGTIQVMGEPIGVNSKDHVAYMSTEPYFYPYMTIKTVGQYHKDFYKDFSLEKFEKLIADMNLDMKMKVSALSSGMASKLKIAATMSRKAKLYMLDEPLNGIDLVARDQIMNAIVENATEDTSLIISSHLVDELEKVLDDVIFIKEGQIVIVGSAEQVREDNGKSIVDMYKEVYAV